MRRHQRNKERSVDAQTRIRQAINVLAVQGQLPDDPGQRSDAIVITARCSKQTLYKYQELWHPKYDPQNLAVSPNVVTALAPSGTGDMSGNSQSGVQADPEVPLVQSGSPASDIKKPLTIGCCCYIGSEKWSSGIIGIMSGEVAVERGVTTDDCLH
ncbi:hypothetical protein [Pantanalinema sp. GBBB05]|uniref:hypothetical protein n=1 Tax=Pantanalinema sp. GBBB05 TaxID=2604139 RepID=UPI001DA40F2D|nr:hypothetical protein [Pantanalinema sp. GBBB05]